tara:strand:+ start:2782 stop:3165 length:384 start_codon:yes stop_codon:yes gene_type:complete
MTRIVGGVPRMGAGFIEQISRWQQTPASPRRKDSPMPTTDFTETRAAAGARYAAACAELQEAMIDLAALDGLAQPAGPCSAEERGLYTFAATNLADGLGDLRHREFLPNPPRGLRAARTARKEQLQA